MKAFPTKPKFKESNFQFIFAVPKAVVDGNYKYSSNLDGSVFAKHNIKEVQFMHIVCYEFNFSILRHQFFHQTLSYTPKTPNLKNGLTTNFNIKRSNDSAIFKNVKIKLLRQAVQYLQLPT